MSIVGRLAIYVCIHYVGIHGSDVGTEASRDRGEEGRLMSQIYEF